MFAKKIPNSLMLNEEKVIANLLVDGEDKMETKMSHLDNGASNHMIGVQAKFKKFDEKFNENVKLCNISILYLSKAKDPSCSRVRTTINIY